MLTKLSSQPWYIQALGVVFVLMLVSKLRLYVLCKVHKAHRAPSHGDWFLGFQFLRETLKESKRGNYQEFIRKKFVDRNIHTGSFKLAGKNVVLTHDPENIKALLATQFNEFCLGARHQYLQITLGDGIFTLDGDGWKHSRAMLRPQFSRDQIGHLETLESSVRILIDIISQKKGAKFNIQPYFYKLTVDNGTNFLFGESCSSLRDDSGAVESAEYGGIDAKLRKTFASAFDYTQDILFLRMNLQSFYWLGHTKEFDRCNNIVHEFTNFYVERALSSSKEELEKISEGRYVFLNELMRETRNPKVLRDQCLNILLAARDTTAGLLSFTFYSLARNPRVYQKLRKAIVETFGEADDVEVSQITFESLKRCEYLKWVLNEVLRMYPSVPRNLRLSTKNTTLPRGGGSDQSEPIFIEKGTPIFYFVYSLHRDEAYYGKDAHEFRPERWGEDFARHVAWAYLPFNGGPRICLGQQLALTTASYVVVRLLQTFPEIRSFDETYPPRLKKHLTMSLMDGANISLS